VIDAGAGADGAGAFSVADASGAPRIVAEGSALTVHNGSGEMVARLDSSDKGAGRLDLANREGQRVLRAGGDTSGTGRLDLTDEHGTTVFTVSGVPGRGALMALLDTTARRQFVVGTTDDGCLLNIMDRNGVPVVVAGLDPDERGGAIILKNSRGRQVVYAGPGPSESGTVLVRDADGEISVTMVPE
jgi:hypothetical protein